MEYDRTTFGTLIFELDVSIIGSIFAHMDVVKISVQILPQVLGGSKHGDHIMLDVMAKPPLVEVWPEKPAAMAGKQQSTGTCLTKAQVLKASRKLLGEEQPPAKRRCGVRCVLPSALPAALPAAPAATGPLPPAPASPPGGRDDGSASSSSDHSDDDEVPAQELIRAAPEVPPYLPTYLPTYLT
jgi:hypothetical protein